MKALWRFLASVQLTVVVLLSLAATSIIGTLIPQNESPAAYHEAFGGYWYRLLGALDVFDMYHAWWFELLLLLLTANIVVCSVDRLRSTGRIIFTRDPAYRAERFRKSRVRAGFAAAVPPAALDDRLASRIERRFGRLRREGDGEARLIFAERWRWSRLGVYTVHLSVVLLVAGGLISALFGFEGHVNIPEGETANRIVLRNSGRPHPLPFAIRCDDFDVSFYPNGAPREYRSHLVLLDEAGNVIAAKQIIVNDPLRHAGINIFQSSYGKLPPAPAAGPGAAPEKVRLSVTSPESGMVYREETVVGGVVALPEGLGRVRVEAYLPNAAFMGRALGPALEVTVEPREGEPNRVLLPLRFPNFDRMRRGRVVLAAEVEGDLPEPVDRYYTGLQVTRDPGVGVVYCGFVAMIVGCFVTFFMSHQQVCVELRPEGRGSAVTLYMVSNRNKMALQRRAERLADELAAAVAPPSDRAGDADPPRT